MKPHYRKQSIKLNTPIGKELINNISSLVEVQLDLSETQDLDLKIGFNETSVGEAVIQFLIKSIKDRTIRFDPNVEHTLYIHKPTKKGQPLPVNNFGLTTRENQIMKLISEGKPDKEVAEILGIKLNTVKAHTKRIHLKLKASNRVEAVIEYLKRTGRLIDNWPDLLISLHQLGSINSLN